jgi:hypothetical protein
LTIYYICRDWPKPAGGERVLYRHVDILNAAGIEAFILHDKPGFRLTWFDNETAVRYSEDTEIDPANDYVVYPETFGREINKYQVRKVVFNQNIFATWANYSLDEFPAYLNDDVLGVMCVSDDSRRGLGYAFPGLHPVRIHVSILPIFQYHQEKKLKLAYMPRRGGSDVHSVLSIIASRGNADGWEVVAIDGMTLEQVAHEFEDTAIFLASGAQEGCPMPPMEAIASGCFVVGYSGYGGEEYFGPAHCYGVMAGDIIQFASTLEQVMSWCKMGKVYPEERKRASEWILNEYSQERERADVLSFWVSLCR